MKRDLVSCCPSDVSPLTTSELLVIKYRVARYISSGKHFSTAQVFLHVNNTIVFTAGSTPYLLTIFEKRQKKFFEGIYARDSCGKTKSTYECGLSLP